MARTPVRPVIPTLIPPEYLDAALDRFEGQLGDLVARAAFGRIRATAAERANGAVAETHRHGLRWRAAAA